MCIRDSGEAEHGAGCAIGRRGGTARGAGAGGATHGGEPSTPGHAPSVALLLGVQPLGRKGLGIGDAQNVVLVLEQQDNGGGVANAEGVQAHVVGARLDHDDLPLEPACHGGEAGSVDPAALAANGHDPLREVGGRISGLDGRRGRIVRRPVRLVERPMGGVLHVVLSNDPNALAELRGLSEELGPL
eukprot:1712845-Alexandrium_andersonii.AAC.1